MSQPIICDGNGINLSSIGYKKIDAGLDNGERVCETERFPSRENSFQMVHGAWRDSMTALFKILWRMKHTV